MNTRRKWAWTALGGLALMLGAGKAEAANPAYLNINVAINANLSVAVNSVASSTDSSALWNTATSNAKLAATSTATVTNDSVGTNEKWALSTNANSIDTGGGTPGSWALTTSSTSVGADQYTVQAVFGSSNTAGGSCPAGTAGSWNASYAPILTTTPVTYSSTVFADTTLTAGGGTPNPDNTSTNRMTAGNFRAMCWRIVTPSSTSTSNTQNIQVIVTASL